LAHLLPASLAPANAPIALVIVAIFAQLGCIHDTRFDFLALNPACLKKRFAPFFRRPFSDRLLLAYFFALASISIGLRENSVWFVHGNPVSAALGAKPSPQQLRWRSSVNAPESVI
jgi:hypothetical protein